MFFTYTLEDDIITINDPERGSTMLMLDYRDYSITKPQIDMGLTSLFKHITYVREAGRMLGVSEGQLIAHDLSKFSCEELPYYIRNFHGDKGDPDGFARAWLHHIHANEHHWQHWIFPDSYMLTGSTVEHGVMEMPYHFALEMIADWMGASKAYTGSFDMADWLTRNMPKIRVHSNTATYLRQELNMLGYGYLVSCQRFANEAS